MCAARRPDSAAIVIIASVCRADCCIDCRTDCHTDSWNDSCTGDRSIDRRRFRDGYTTVTRRLHRSQAVETRRAQQEQLRGQLSFFDQATRESSRGFNSWVEYRNLWAKRRRGFQIWINRGVSFAFNSWEEMTARRVSVLKLHAQKQRFHVLTYFKTLVAHAIGERDAASVVGSAVSSWMHRHQRRAFGVWQSVTNDERVLVNAGKVLKLQTLRGRHMAVTWPLRGRYVAGAQATDARGQAAARFLQLAPLSRDAAPDGGRRAHDAAPRLPLGRLPLAPARSDAGVDQTAGTRRVTPHLFSDAKGMVPPVAPRGDDVPRGAGRGAAGAVT